SFLKDGVLYWVPLGQRGALSGLPASWITDRTQRQLKLLGRLQPGVTLAQVQARADLIDADLAREFPASNAGLRMNVTGEMEGLKTDLRTEGHRLRRPSLRQLLVIAQLAVSLIVVTTGGLFLLSLKKMETIDPGYRPEGLVSANLNPGLFTDDPVIVRHFFD